VLYVRTQMPPTLLIRPVEVELAALNNAIPFAEVHTMAEEVQDSTAGDRLTAVLASLFGVLAALLAAVGIYSLFAFVAAHRKFELAIRIAMGATPLDIAALLTSEALTITSIDVCAGIAFVLLVGPLARSLLFGVAPQDWLSLCSAAMLVIFVAATGTAIPIFHASQIKPAAILRRGD
jgi:putative ABC transport system permease protein